MSENSWVSVRELDLASVVGVCAVGGDSLSAQTPQTAVVAIARRAQTPQTAQKKLGF